MTKEESKELVDELKVILERASVEYVKELLKDLIKKHEPVKEDYRPLPYELTLDKSDYLSNITGKRELGLFAFKDIPEGTKWMTHVKTDDPIFEDGLIRMPVGGFFNHNSKDPNCVVLDEEKYIFFETLRDIEEGEELTAKYTLYDPEKK